jgi:hypothetical protein
MTLRTVFLGRLAGLYCLVLAVAMLLRRQETLDLFTAFVRSPVAIYLTGIFALILGLAMILGHNYWSGGALRVIVTLVGWAALVKSMLLLLLPAGMIAMYLQVFHLARLYYGYTALFFALGAYLTYAGFRAKAE